MLVIICAYNKKNSCLQKKKKMCVREREITFVLL